MLRRWLRYLWENEDGFFGIGIGPSSAEKSQYGSLANLANFATGEGENDIASSDKFFQAILSGDPGQISKVLGPEISGVNKRGQEAKKTGAEFGNRGGGTNSRAASIDDSTRSSIDSTVSSLTGTAAEALGASGQGLLSAGASAHEGAFSDANTIQQQHEAQMNDLFKSIAAVAAAPFTGGATLGGLAASSGTGGGTPAFGNLSPGQISGAFSGPTSAPTTTSDLSWTLDS
jgi:hypothetical protein